jgi:hypothetical protein
LSCSDGKIREGGRICFAEVESNLMTTAASVKTATVARTDWQKTHRNDRLPFFQ